MESKFTDILIKRDLINSFLQDAISLKGGDFSDRLAWTLGFSDSPSTILNYIKLPTSLISLLAGNCPSDALRKEINDMLLLLPYNINCNGLMIFADLLDKIQQEETAKAINSQLQQHAAFKGQTLTFTFIKKSEGKGRELQSEDFHCLVVEKDDAKTIGISLDKQETALFELSKNYFSILIPISLPVAVQSTVSEVLGSSGSDSESEITNAILNFKNTDLVFSLNGEEIEVTKEKLKETLKSLKQSGKKSKDDYTNFLSFIPTQEAVLMFSKKPRGDIHANSIIIQSKQTVLVNDFELLGYFRYDCDLRREFQSFGKYLTGKISSVVSSQLNNPKSAHSQALLTFCNSFTGVGITLPFRNSNDEDNANLRRIYHQRLHLPMDRPLLRTGDSIYANKKLIEADTSGKLRDVHYGLTTKGVPDGVKYMIQGSYIYYHYMQDGFDDQGWGCAYRSLQTLLSWYKVQRLVPDFKVPTIPEIQKILTDMGDKPKEFAGSKEWIGAFEVNLVLNKLLGVESRILFISRGSEIPSKARELKEHFLTEGTPIMIGGGVLAYTLLGIDYNDETGDVKFLILDPHYTGSDTLKTIQDKGWVGWKESKLFVEDTFYNFCLPQRQKSI